jgi:transcriptional regulator of acetoin/glycerol metabolism
MKQASTAAQIDRRIALAEQFDTPIAKSWRRSIEMHQLDPGRTVQPCVLLAHNLRDYQVPLEQFIHTARNGMERLYDQIHGAGYVVLLTDARGITVDYLHNEQYDRELRRAGLYLGACWSEELEGTCAVGLCGIERSPVTVHQDEHFRSPNTTLTCSSAPIFSPDGNLLAILDASALSSPNDKRSQHLVLHMVSETARMIENAHFLKEYEHSLILRISTKRDFLDVNIESLIALNEEGVIQAANNCARVTLGLDKYFPSGKRIEDLFGLRIEDLLTVNSRCSAAASLRCLRTARLFFGVINLPRRMASHEVLVAASASSRPAGERTPLKRLTGSDPQMAVNVEQALRILGKGIPVMLHGETGTGKEMFARAIHESSLRRSSAFVALNCSAIPESLIESELFGYREGAFTGARAKGGRGKIAQADGGTIFLDEIGDMPLTLQTRLLRVLSEREILPLGAEKPVAVDLQVICATHRDLTAMVRAGQFRQDLYFRLNGLVLQLPALRERSDKGNLIQQLLREEAAEQECEHYGLDESALNLLLCYDWPGNIRQLKNTLRSALALSDAGWITTKQLPAEIQQTIQQATPPYRIASQLCEMPKKSECIPEPVSSPDLSEKKQTLLFTLKQHHWNIALAARELGICRATVYRHMQRYGIVPPNFRD